MDEEFIENVLDELEIPLNLDGYRYLVDAIMIMNKKDLRICRLYFEIAKKNKVNISSVERNIRTIAQKCGIKLGKKLKLKCRMTNSILIEAIYRYAKRRCSK